MTSHSIGYTAPPSESPDPRRTVVRTADGPRLQLRDVRGYGPLIRVLASRDLKARYKQSALGPAWVVFQPLALLAAFSIGFRSVAHVRTAGVPYVLFALTGLVVWTYFQATTTVAVGSLVNNYALVRWTACPRLALPLGSLVANLPSFAIPAIAAVVAAAIDGRVGVGWVLLPLLVVWLFALVAAASLFLAALAVRARDVFSVLPFLLQVTMFLAPVAYRTSQLSPALRTALSFNPLTGLIDTWRWSLLGIHPDLLAVALSITFSVGGVILSWKFFARFDAHMADEI